MVLCYPEGAWLECLPPAELVCEEPLLRGWETRLRMQLFHHETIRDDHIVAGHFNVGWVGGPTGWGLETATEYAAGAAPRAETAYHLHPNLDLQLQATTAHGAYRWEPPLREPADLARLAAPRLFIDEAASRARLALADEIFGDLLPVRQHGWQWLGAGLGQTAVQLRGMETLMLDCLDRPAWVHDFVARLARGTGAYLDEWEAGGYLSLNNDDEWVGTGGVGCTDELPAPGADPARPRLRDLWGFAQNQDLLGFSPAMLDEFFLTYTRPLMARFGLTCYGCCEPLDDRLELVRDLPGLRRLAASPWADIRRMAEGAGGEVLLAWKPSPTLLSTGRYDEEALRRVLREGLAACRANGTPVEVTMKDLHSVQGDPQRLQRFVALCREAIQADG
jgi:hypothetical protein